MAELIVAGALQLGGQGLGGGAQLQVGEGAKSAGRPAYSRRASAKLK